MKTLFIIAFLLIASTAICQTNPKGVKWDSVILNEDDSICIDLEGYKIFTSTESGTNYILLQDLPLSSFIDPENPSYDFDLENFIDGQYYSVILAYDLAGNKSGYSNEVTFTVDNTSPSNPSNYECMDQITININIGN